MYLPEQIKNVFNEKKIKTPIMYFFIPINLLSLWYWGSVIYLNT